MDRTITQVIVPTRKLTFSAVGFSGVKTGTRPNVECAKNGCSFVESDSELRNESTIFVAQLGLRVGGMYS